MSPTELWQAALAQLQLNISSANFITWFKNTEIISFENGKVVISVPNSFVKEWLEQKYNKMVFRALHSLDEKIKEIKYVINKPNLKVINKNNYYDNYNDNLNRLKFTEFFVNKETNLNNRYGFDNFVVGPFNELAHAAALAVSKNPGEVYNPLFIYGGVGLGKTHLIQATGNEIVKNFSDKKVKYVSTEKFVSGVISAIKNQEMESFKERYRRIDVLILDDVQFLAGKEKTQEEFFHIFNALYEKNKQIIISSDRPPKTIPALTERLRSRFEGGMLTDISFPDFETRIAILKMKAGEQQLILQDDVLEYIAKNIQQNIRELEGTVNQLVAYQKLQNKNPDIDVAKNLLKKAALIKNRATTPSKIIQTVAHFYDLKEKDLLTLSRRKEIVKPRQVAMYLLRSELNCSFPFIGRKFNGKDHTTAIYSFEKIHKEIQENERLADEILSIKQRVYEG